MKTILHLLLFTFLFSLSIPKCITSKNYLEKTCEKKNIEKDYEEDEVFKIVFIKTVTSCNYKSNLITTSYHNIHSALIIHNINLKIATPPPKETVVFLPT